MVASRRDLGRERKSPGRPRGEKKKKQVGASMRGVFWLWRREMTALVSSRVRGRELCARSCGQLAKGGDGGGKTFGGAWSRRVLPRLSGGPSQADPIPSSPLPPPPASLVNFWFPLHLLAAQLYHARRSALLTPFPDDILGSLFVLAPASLLPVALAGVAAFQTVSLVVFQGLTRSLPRPRRPASLGLRESLGTIARELTTPPSRAFFPIRSWLAPPRYPPACLLGWHARPPRRPAPACYPRSIDGSVSDEVASIT